MPRQQNGIMKRTIILWCLLPSLALAADPTPATNKVEKAETSIFPDKNLEKAVRKLVFEKRDNDKPITEADVANLSTVEGKGLQIKDLTGLEKCRSLASLDLAKNAI